MELAQRSRRGGNLGGVIGVVKERPLSEPTLEGCRDAAAGGATIAGPSSRTGSTVMADEYEGRRSEDSVEKELEIERLVIVRKTFSVSDLEDETAASGNKGRSSWIGTSAILSYRVLDPAVEEV